ncbi:TAF5-like RNA polymerase subunit [Halotydeus destructor]|nr:TAF5-like RNA polymerase subunit [Halotydeus destructor]
MKRSLDVDQIVQSYLKKRNYPSESHLKLKSRQRTISLTELVLSMAADSCSSSRSLVTINVKSSEELLKQLDPSFEDLVKLVDSCPGSENGTSSTSRLEHFVFLVFSIYFTHIFQLGHLVAAKDFYEKHQPRFQRTQERSEQLEAIAESLANQSLDVRLAKFLTSKTLITVKETDLNLLSRHLESSNNLLLHHVIDNRIVIKISRLKDPALTNGTNHHNHIEHNHDNFIANHSNASSTPLSTNHKKPSFACLCSVQRHASCGAISTNCTQVAFGYETSDVELVSIKQDDGCDFSMQQSSNTTLSFNLPQLSRLQEDGGNLKKPGSGSRTVGPKVTLKGHSGPVFGLSFIPNSNILLSSSKDTSIRAWDTRSGSSLAIYCGHNYSVWSVTSSALGLYFASGSKDGTARLWTLERAYPLRIFAGHTQDVDVVRFHPNTKYLATGSSDCTVRLWNIQDGRQVRVFNGHQSAIRSLAFSADGKHLASGSDDRKIKLWDIGSAKMADEFSGHSDSVMDLNYNQSRSQLASCSMDRTLKLWETSLSSVSDLQNGTQDYNQSNGLDPVASYAQAGQVFLTAQFDNNNYLTAVSGIS